MNKPTAEQARKQERDAIVAWLTVEADENFDSGYPEGAMAYATFMYVIDSLQRGDHLEGDK